eukprot:7499658-Alexandrium_andersonii.AAC.1
MQLGAQLHGHILLALLATRTRRSPLGQTLPDHVGVGLDDGGIAADALALDAGQALAALALAHR